VRQRRKRGRGSSLSPPHARGAGALIRSTNQLADQTQFAPAGMRGSNPIRSRSHARSKPNASQPRADQTRFAPARACGSNPICFISRARSKPNRSHRKSSAIFKNLQECSGIFSASEQGKNETNPLRRVVHRAGRVARSETCQAHFRKLPKTSDSPRSSQPDPLNLKSERRARNRLSDISFRRNKAKLSINTCQNATCVYRCKPFNSHNRALRRFQIAEPGSGVMIQQRSPFFGGLL
jgi:hypothetical protein